MMMQIYHFTYKDCGYELKLPLGSSGLDQVLTDVTRTMLITIFSDVTKNPNWYMPIFIASILKANALPMEVI
jgi:hypothetical protein